MSGWLLDYSYKCQPVDYSHNPSALRMANLCWWYFISKFTEFADTVRTNFCKAEFAQLYNRIKLVNKDYTRQRNKSPKRKHPLFCDIFFARKLTCKRNREERFFGSPFGVIVRWPTRIRGDRRRKRRNPRRNHCVSDSIASARYDSAYKIKSLGKRMPSFVEFCHQKFEISHGVETRSIRL